MDKIWRNMIDMPPVWLVVFLGLVWGQVQVFNPGAYGFEAADMVGWGLIGGGVGVMLLAFVMFLRHKTSVIPKRRPANIITSGPYAFSRNPIYLADAMILTGFVLIQGSVLGILLVPVFIWVIQKRFIIGEEAGLRQDFAAEFAEYCQKTRRWI